MFVCKEVSKLSLSGKVAEVMREDLVVCNPLGVVRKSVGNLGLLWTCITSISISNRADLNMRTNILQLSYSEG